MRREGGSRKSNMLCKRVHKHTLYQDHDYTNEEEHLTLLHTEEERAKAVLREMKGERERER